MQIYKLFSQNPRARKLRFSNLNTEFIIGSSDTVFGLKVDPEQYREFLNSIRKYLLKNRISQHIMTDYKFLEFIRQSSKLNFELSDVTFYDEEQYKDDELVKDIKDILWKPNKELLLVYLEEAINSGFRIFSLTGNIHNSIGELELIKIYANGTISVESNFQEEKRYPIIDYLIKGPEVFL